MATLNLDENRATYLIRAYTPGEIRINEAIYTQSLILTPTQLIHPWPVSSSQELTADSLHCLLELKPTILLIGTGAEMAYLPVSLYGELLNAGIGVEFMGTRAACRTFNALASEDRNVAAALILR